MVNPLTALLLGVVLVTGMGLLSSLVATLLHYRQAAEERKEKTERLRMLLDFAREDPEMRQKLLADPLVLETVKEMKAWEKALARGKS